MKTHYIFLSITIILCVFTLTYAEKEVGTNMQLTSKDFKDHGDIPQKYTCDGQDISPSLQWTDIPSAAKSLVLIVDDPDAPDPANPKMTWVHWILYNIPADTGSLSRGIKPEELPGNTLEGLNDWGKTGYGGPCPPIGEHRYFHKLYALDTVLPDLHKPTKAELEEAMEGHIISRVELVGLYKKK